MIVLGYVIQNLSSPTEKIHSAYALDAGQYVVSHGPASSAGTTRPTPMNTMEAARKVASIMATKQSEGYDRIVVPLVMAELPDGTTHRNLRQAVTDAHASGLTTEFTFPESAVEQFLAAVSNQSPAQPDPVTIGTAARVEDRDNALTLPDGEALVRPNGETYLPRDLGGHTDVAALRALRPADLYPLLAGEPGTGKTALADASFPDLIMMQCHGDMTVSSLVGTHLPTPDGGWVWHDGPLTRSMREGRPLCLDEVDKMPDEVSSVLHAAMDGRKTLQIDDRPDTEPVTAAEGFFVIAAYNPDSLGGKGLTEAMLSRFTVQIEVTTDYAAARSLGVPGDFVTIAENLTTKATEARAAGGRGVWAPQMRELLAAKRLIDAGLGATFAAGSMVAQCPWPEDLDEVLTVARQVTGTEVQPLRLGAQV
ncbi:MAG: AAA family ATPase [Nocardioides sp.]|nr:AAA family ATPase [Nocardioides sp.]